MLHPRSHQNRELINAGVLLRPAARKCRFYQGLLLRRSQASAQAQAEAMKEAQKAGISHAKAKGNVYRGRKPTYSAEQLNMVGDLLAAGRGISDIAREVGLSRQTVHRLRADRVAAEASLVNWA